MNKCLSLIYTSDIHGALFPIDYVSNSWSERGILWLKDYLKKIKNPYLLLDNGDLMQGTPLMDLWLASSMDEPAPLNLAYNELKYDYLNIGNHDFNYGLKAQKRFFELMDAQTLCANIEGLPYQKYVIREINEIKVGIIGVVTQHLPHWEHPENLKGLEIHDAYEYLKEIVPKVKTQCDVLVVLYHGGFERDLKTGQKIGRDTLENEGYQIASELDIDVLLCGHQHQRFGPHILNNTLTMEIRDSGKELGRVDLEFTRIEGKWELTSKKGQIVPCHYSKNYQVSDELEVWAERVEIELSKPLGTCDERYAIKDQFQARLNQNPLFDYLGQVILDYTGADIAASSLNNSAPGFKGLITQRDIFSNFIYPNTFMVISVTGAKLKAALERCAAFFDKQDGKYQVGEAFLKPKVEYYNYDVFVGLDYVIDINKPIGERITSMKFKGKDIQATDKLSLALYNYRAVGGGEYTMYEDCEIIREFPLSAQEIYRQRIIKDGGIKESKCWYQIKK